MITVRIFYFLWKQELTRDNLNGLLIILAILLLLLFQLTVFREGCSSFGRIQQIFDLSLILSSNRIIHTLIKTKIRMYSDFLRLFMVSFTTTFKKGYGKKLLTSLILKITLGLFLVILMSYPVLKKNLRQA